MSRLYSGPDSQKFFSSQLAACAGASEASPHAKAKATDTMRLNMALPRNRRQRAALHRGGQAYKLSEPYVAGHRDNPATPLRRRWRDSKARVDDLLNVPNRVFPQKFARHRWLTTAFRGSRAPSLAPPCYEI